METDGRLDSGKCGEGLIFIITIGPIEDRCLTGEWKYI